MKILFIGSSHTCCNELPSVLKKWWKHIRETIPEDRKNAGRASGEPGPDRFPGEPSAQPSFMGHSFRGGANVLSGKKWAACGDSFTHGDFTGLDDASCRIQEGRYRGMYRVYPYLIGNRNDMTVINKAVNGATIADNPASDDLHVFVRGAYRDIPEDADYITLRFGINDWHQEIPIGTPDDTDPKTFYGAWNTVLPFLIRKHPYAKIGIIITNGTTPEYTEPQRVMAGKWGIPFLDMQKDPRVPLMHRVNERPGVCEEALNLRMEAFSVSETNRHPNPQAHEFESTFIENFLRSL